MSLIWSKGEKEVELTTGTYDLFFSVPEYYYTNLPYLTGKSFTVSNKTFSVLDQTLDVVNGKLIVRIDIQENPWPIALLVTLLIGGLVAYIVLDKIEKVADKSTGLIILLVIGAFMWFQITRRKIWSPF